RSGADAGGHAGNPCLVCSIAVGSPHRTRRKEMGVRGSMRTLGISLALMVATAIALPAASAAASTGSTDSRSQLGHTDLGGGAGASGPATGGTPDFVPSPAPASHALGSRVVVPSNWSLQPSPNAGSTIINLLRGVS